ncbi:MAG: hypothetical protein M3Z64_08670 [Verrucomicrobiota bacterium]|nr:hypothetical protein [Verrucomicrobiota bacterium]
MLLRVAAVSLFVLSALSARGQEAVAIDQTGKPGVAADSSVGSAWLDLRLSTPQNSKPQSAPSWVEAVTVVPPQATPGVAAQTIFRIRLARPRADFRVLLFRLFFDDKTNQQPSLIAWDESGTQVLRSGALGSGIELPTSQTVMVPMAGVSTIDIEVPGDGTTIRGAYLDWMTSTEVLHPLSAEHRDLIPEPFAAAAPLHAPVQDQEAFGTVTATLADETIRIGASIQTGASFQFGIESQPLVALLTFEVASPYMDSPPEIYLNGENIGAVTLALPDLADPGYRGETAPLVRQMRFQYTGWVRAQKLVPAASLRAGSNDLLVIGGPGTPASAIRATQIQLKYLWDKSDYRLVPDR